MTERKAARPDYVPLTDYFVLKKSNDALSAALELWMQTVENVTMTDAQLEAFIATNAALAEVSL